MDKSREFITIVYKVQMYGGKNVIIKERFLIIKTLRRREKKKNITVRMGNH